MTNKELLDLLVKAGKSEDDVKSLKKAELIALLEADDEASEDLDSLTPKELKAKIKEKDAALADQESVIVDLKAENSSKENLKGDVIASYDGENYKFLCGKFTLPAGDQAGEGTSYTAEESAKDSAVMKRLVESKSGLLQKI